LESDTNKKSIIKFIGLGKYGYQHLQRAQALAEAKFSPEVESLHEGFIELAFCKGTPLSYSDINENFINFVCKYLEFVNYNFKAEQRVSFDKMIEMIYYNVEQGIGSRFLFKVEKIAKEYKNLYEEDVVAVDGRLLPHDFIKGEQGYIKVDHLEHHADQFFHGSQNIAWDVAGFCVEFGLTENSRRMVISRFKYVDNFIDKKLPFFLIAYSACRLGYVKLAADSLFGNYDGNKFRYRENLLVKDLKCLLNRI
ncbi:MAG: hypothetical protein GX640_10700, partial [Fibrobacter sp.]|nr:hypothetical protein [Fibrobacter sp.]